MTGERPTEQVRLEQINGLQYRTEDRPQAELVACAAVNYVFPRADGKQYTPENLRSEEVNICSDFVSKTFFTAGKKHTDYFETDFTQRDETGPVKLAFRRPDDFIGANRMGIIQHIEAETGVDCQPPVRELRRTFDDTREFTAYLQTEDAPISQEDLDSFARRRAFLALTKRLGKKVEKAGTRYMEASEVERIELLDKTVRKAQQVMSGWDQIAVPFGYRKPTPALSDQQVYGSFLWPDIEDDGVLVRGMVVAGGYYDLKNHRFNPEKMNSQCKTQIIGWLSPKHPSYKTTEKRFGPRIDDIAYDLGATATEAFKKAYEKKFLHPKPKSISKRPKNRPLYVDAHQVHREIRPTPNPFKDFFGDY